MQRHVLGGLSLAVVVAGSPSVGAAQTRGRGPTATTPHILIATLHGPDRALGNKMADELRNKIKDENSERDLYVVPHENINDYLKSSGYQPDSAVSITDLKELAKGINAQEILDGTATRQGGAVRAEMRLYLAQDISSSQPLDPVTGKNESDAAALIEKQLTAARRQLPDNGRCLMLSRESKYAEAAKAALEGIRAYPRATLARTCLAKVYLSLKYPPDSLLRVANEITQIDPDNLFAWNLKYKAYDDKKDAANTLAAAIKLQKLDPSNQSLGANVVTLLANSPEPEKALPIVDELLSQNAGDPNLLNIKWKLLQKLNRFKESIPVGEAMVRSDTALADSTYYFRQMWAAYTDSNWVKSAEFAGGGARKYTKDAEFPYMQGNAYRKSGKLAEAGQAYRRTLALNPTTPTPKDVRLLLATTFTELNQLDSVVALSRAAVAAGDDKKIWGQLLLKPAQATFQAAQAAKTAQASSWVDDFKKSLALAQYADSLDSSPTSHFFIGLSAYFIAADVIQQLQDGNTAKLPADRMCPLAKSAEDYFALVQVHLPKGGSLDPQNAGQILGSLGQYTTFIDAIKKLQKC